MELGARVCTPRSPDCPHCPIRRCCDAYAGDCAEALPVRKPPKVTPHYTIVAAAIGKSGRYLLGRRPDAAMLGGLWEFPGGKVEPAETHAGALRRELAEELGIDVRVGEPLATVDHAYSHFSITLHLYRCDIIAGAPRNRYHTQIKWVRRSQFDQYAFPQANRKLFANVP